MIDISNKTVLITGASRGIGEAAAREFANHGANVVLVARSTVQIKSIADDIATEGGKAISVSCDVSDNIAVENMIETAVKTFGGLDIVINNAGIIDPIERINGSDPKGWGKVIDVNVKGVYYVMRAVLKHMQSGGTIITIGSGAASTALEGWSHYSASKAAVHHLNSCLHAEESVNGIRALVLSPGTVATDMQVAIKNSGVNAVSRLDWSDHIPADWPAKALVWMSTSDADGWLGQVISLRDEAIRRRVGLIK